jgi:oligopeptide/dipeptide ABC transporter ATP-binding protein
MGRLELEDVVVEYRRRDGRTVTAVAGASLTVEPGQVVGLVGESGCGKSTLARAAVGLVRTASGRVRFGGEEVTALRRLGSRSTAHLGLQMVFQDPYSSLNPRRRVRDQLADSLRAVGAPAPDWDARIADLLEQVGLPATAAGNYPHEFSGGQRQRISIARVLALDPRVIVADEPISALDASTQASVGRLLLGLSRDLGVGILFISHDLAIVRRISDEVNVMYLGRIVERAPAAVVWDRPEHPYTQALIGAVPKADGSGRLPVFLRGEVPDPADPPEGCRFHPRCPVAVDRCGQEDQVLRPLTGDHAVACLLRAP